MYGIPKPPPKASIGKQAKLLPTRAGLASLGKSNRTLFDYSKQVPTQDIGDPHPLLVDLLRKQQP